MNDFFANLTLYKSIIVVFVLIILVGAGFAFYYLLQIGPLPPKSWKIGFLALAEKDVQSENYLGFKEGMEVLGYKDGLNVSYTVKIGTRGKDLEMVAQEMNEAGFDVIITGSTSVTKALKDLPSLRTPVFFLAAGAPRDLVANLQEPEGFITGIGEPTAEFAEKRLEFLKEIAPSIKKVASIIERGHPTNTIAQQGINKAAEKLGIKMELIEIDRDKPEQILNKLSFITKGRGADAYIACTCPSNEKFSRELAAHFIKEKIPAINGEMQIGANLGWLASYSNDRRKTGRSAAEKVDKILNGTPISKIPVEVAKDLVLEINAQTAKDVGIEIPTNVLYRANRIYQQ